MEQYPLSNSNHAVIVVKNRVPIYEKKLFLDSEYFNCSNGQKHENKPNTNMNMTRQHALQCSTFASASSNSSREASNLTEDAAFWLCLHKAWYLTQTQLHQLT